MSEECHPRHEWVALQSALGHFKKKCSMDIYQKVLEDNQPFLEAQFLWWSNRKIGIGICQK